MCIQLDNEKYHFGSTGALNTKYPQLTFTFGLNALGGGLHGKEAAPHHKSTTSIPAKTSTAAAAPTASKSGLTKTQCSTSKLHETKPKPEPRVRKATLDNHYIPPATHSSIHQKSAGEQKNLPKKPGDAQNVPMTRSKLAAEQIKAQDSIKHVKASSKESTRVAVASQKTDVSNNFNKHATDNSAGVTTRSLRNTKNVCIRMYLFLS